MKPIQFALRASAAGALALAMAASANAATQQLTVTVENLSAANGYATGPLQVGFGNGSFDAFNIGSMASAAIVPVAELGSGSAWPLFFIFNCCKYRNYFIYDYFTNLIFVEYDNGK